MVIGLRFKRFYIFLIICWIYSIQFSHAPTYLHPLISIPGILSIFIILIFILNEFTKIYKNPFFILTLLIVPITCIFTLPNLNSFNDKFIPYALAHFWFILFSCVIYFTPHFYKLDEKRILHALCIGIGISVLYSFFETISPLLSFDINILPRYDRQNYKVWTPFLFFRTRAFNYESANFSILINVYFSLIFYFFNRFKYTNKFSMFFTIFIWAISLLFTYGSLQIIFFVTFSFIWLFRKFSLLKAIFAFVFVLIIITIAPEILGDILNKANGESESSEIRYFLFNEGIEAIEKSPFWVMDMLIS